VIRQGVDPHSFTAAMFEGISIEAFAEHPARKTLRQRAKALNFGIPGGLGAKSLVSYASASYGVTLTVDDAAAFRDRLTTEVYPELSKYLEDNAVETLALNLRSDAVLVRGRFETGGAIGAAKRIVAGKGKANGGNYQKGFVDRVWWSLRELNRNRSLKWQIENRIAGDKLQRSLFCGPVTTLTGRVRGSVGYSQARNTPFQGLAADGAKLALWDLYKAGYRCVAFIHDEVLIELPIDGDHTRHAELIDGILCEAMQRLTGSIPIACEYALTDRWRKEAEAVFDADGKLQLWYPPRS
jgi:DNA polymerase I-like protein with 3'-5' exonuclease and polymerase domains